MQLEAPLYPENDEVLALGDVNFKNNTVVVHHSINDMKLNELNGSLQFDQEGVLDSNLKSIILSFPTSIVIQSVHEPKPYTKVKIEGQTTIDVLQKQFNLPVFALMQGSLWLETVLMLSDDPNDLDNFRLQSSLQGLRIDLPSPLGKSAETKAPLTVDIDFNPQKAARLRFNYDNRLSSDLWFSGSKGSLPCKKVTSGWATMSFCKRARRVCKL